MKLTDSQTALLATAIKWNHVGSSFTCNPVPAGCDFDYLVLLDPAKAESFIAGMKESGFNIELGEGYAANVWTEALFDEVFNSYRAGDINFVITCSASFYNKFMAATDLAKRFNLLVKMDRIVLFQAVLYGNRPLPPLQSFTLPPFPEALK